MPLITAGVVLTILILIINNVCPFPAQTTPRSPSGGAGPGAPLPLAPCGFHFPPAPGLKAGDGGPLVRVGPARFDSPRPDSGSPRGSQPRPGPAEGGGPARPRLLGAAMAGLEALYASARAAVSRPQDALLCGLHWELVRHGYRCLGAGEQVRVGHGRAGPPVPGRPLR